MNFRRSRTAGPKADINLAPLVDVVLLLVLFFMVTAQFVVLPGLQLTLPSVAGETLAQTGAERLDISLSKENDLYFEGRATTIADLPRLLERSGAVGSDVVVLISADREAAYGAIMAIMEVLRLNGFHRLVFTAAIHQNTASKGAEY